MEFFEKAKTVRLKSQHNKYLWADDDKYKCYQNKERMNISAHWRVERDPESKCVRLKSCHDTYLTASDDNFLTGMTGKKVVQSSPKHIDSSVEWEPIREGKYVKLKTCHGNFLRANKALGPPWRNSVTHDVPHRMQKHQDYLLWEIQTVWEANMSSNGHAFGSYGEENKPSMAHTPYVPSPSGALASPSSFSSHHPPSHTDSMDHSPSHSEDSVHSTQHANSNFTYSPPRANSLPGTPHFQSHAPYVSSVPPAPLSSQPSRVADGRVIFYALAVDLDEARRLDETDWPSFTFKGHTLNALKKQLQKVLEIDEDILLCARHPSSTNLFQLKLPTLPPNNQSMHIIVVKNSSSFDKGEADGDH